MAYRIRFENVKDAKAPAQWVAVTDIPDEDFEFDTFELSDITFATQTISMPRGLSDYRTRMVLIGTSSTAACARTSSP